MPLNEHGQRSLDNGVADVAGSATHELQRANLREHRGRFVECTQRKRDLVVWTHRGRLQIIESPLARKLDNAHLDIVRRDDHVRQNALQRRSHNIKVRLANGVGSIELQHKAQMRKKSEKIERPRFNSTNNNHYYTVLII